VFFGVLGGGPRGTGEDGGQVVCIWGILALIWFLGGSKVRVTGFARVQHNGGVLLG
jgi:hypothetical protein